MARRATLNKRRLTRRQVKELISSGARLHPDLSVALEPTLLQPRVYQLEGERYLLVFGETIAGLAGKGDLYEAEIFHRFVRRVAKADEDARHGRQSSVGHWTYYSAHKYHLTENIDALVAQLRSTMAKTKDELDFSYQSLDAVSAYVERIGIERAEREIYDHLVAYLGEVLRLRIQGHWTVNNAIGSPIHIWWERCTIPSCRSTWFSKSSRASCRST